MFFELKKWKKSDLDNIDVLNLSEMDISNSIGE